MATEYFRVRLTGEAKKALLSIGKRHGKKAYEVLRNLIQDLEFEPTQKGEPLRSPLHGLYSRHYSRFRIIYRVEERIAEVLVVTAGYHAKGARDDIYTLLERALARGKLIIRADDADQPQA